MTSSHYAPLLAHIEKLIANQTYSHCYLFVGTQEDTLPALGEALAVRFIGMTKNVAERIHAGNHPDVHWLAPENDQKTIKIQQVRDVTKALVQAPAEADCQVLVVPEVAQLTLSAANGLLKVIEEPVGPQVTLLFAARQQDVLATLQSRAQIVTLPAIAVGPDASWFADGQRILLKWCELWLFQQLSAMTYLATTVLPFFDTKDKQNQFLEWLQQVMRDITVCQTLPATQLYFPKVTGFYDALQKAYTLDVRVALADQVLQSDHTLTVAISWQTRLEKIMLDCWHILEKM